MSKNSKNLISKTRADALFNIFSQLTLNTVNKYWNTFQATEENLYPRIAYLIDKNAKAFVSNLIKFSQEEPLEEGFLDDYIPTPEDHIEDALKVSKLYTNSSNVFKGLFMFGMYAGRAMSQVEFEANHSLNELITPYNEMIVQTEDQLDELDNVSCYSEEDLLSKYGSTYIQDLDEETLEKNYEEIMEKLKSFNSSIEEKNLDTEEVSEEEIQELDSELMKEFFNAIMKMYSDDEKDKD